jgi:hypothetical protein
MDSTRDELRQAADHARRALRATLKAARGALDAAIVRLDDEAPAAARPTEGGAGDASPTGDESRT